MYVIIYMKTYAEINYLHYCLINLFDPILLHRLRPYVCDNRTQRKYVVNVILFIALMI